MRSAIWIYPWDVLDEGAATVVDRIADAGIDTVSVAAAYHNVRALCAHNPRRAVYHGEGGVLYFRHDPARFAPEALPPRPSALLGVADPLRLLCAEAGRAGLRTRAWTVLHHNTQLGMEHPDCCVRNAFDDVYPFALCPANPAVRAYDAGVVGSLAAVEGLAAVEMESAGYMGMDHSGHHAKRGIETDPGHRFLLSICFCRHCCARMAERGLDAVRAQARVADGVRAWLASDGLSAVTPEEALAAALGEEEARALVGARDDVVVSLLAELRKAAGTAIALLPMATADRYATGAPLSAPVQDVAALSDGLICQVFAADPAEVEASIRAVVRSAGDRPVDAGIQAIPPAVRSQEDLGELAAAAARAGAAGIEVYHFGLMRLQTLTWVRTALEATGPAPPRD